MISLLILHLTGGALAATTGVVALYARKGAMLHRRCGLIFTYAMISMSFTGLAVTAAGGRTSPVNVVAGLLTTYLVITALTTVSPRSARVQAIDRGAMIGAIVFGAVCVVSALGIVIAGGGRLRALMIVLLIVGSVALAASTGDRAMIRAGGFQGTRRLRRHVWRMCLALFILVASFVFGRRFPAPLRLLPIRLLPFVVPVTMTVWLWRLRRTPASMMPRIAAQM